MNLKTRVLEQYILKTKLIVVLVSGTYVLGPLLYNSTVTVLYS